MDDSEPRIRVLLSAYACEPGKGSEPGVGWNVAKELSPRVDLTVVTRANNRISIENSSEPWIKAVRWIFWDPPRWLTFWKKGGRGVQIYYAIWQWGLKSRIRKETTLGRFDIIHHVTFGKYWIPSRLPGLGIPFVFGPVGGGETTPGELVPSLGARGKLAECLKRTAIHMVTCLPGARRLYHAAAWTFAATPQTGAALAKLGVKRLGVLPQSGIRRGDVPTFPLSSSSGDHAGLHLVTAARLIHWKGIDLVIEAVAIAAKTIDVRLAVLQTGPELRRLKALATRLGIAGRVEFKGRLPKLSDVYEEISKADALMHPALHEAFGQSCLESLALGVPVICLDWAGPGMIIDGNTGFAVKPGTRDDTVSRLADAIMRLPEFSRNRQSASELCKARAFEEFNWSNLADAFITAYKGALPARTCVSPDRAD